jgi:predicted transposase/invertase (TIGR01784 family)
MRYLDPKNDLTFKRIFGEHPHLLKSFLNAVLPLPQPIDTIEYLPAELVPEIPVFKNSIVDVRCVDKHGRQFIVEMQML